MQEHSRIIHRSRRRCRSIAGAYTEAGECSGAEQGHTQEQENVQEQSRGIHRSRRIVQEQNRSIHRSRRRNLAKDPEDMRYPETF